MLGGATGKFMTTYHGHGEAEIMVSEEKAKVKEDGDRVLGQFPGSSSYR
jgi:hypothetical protein